MKVRVKNYFILRLHLHHQTYTQWASCKNIFLFLFPLTFFWGFFQNCGVSVVLTWCPVCSHILYLAQLLSHSRNLCFLCLCSPLTILLYRILANHATCREDRQRFLLDGLSQIQLAVSEQERVALNAQRLLPSQEEVNKVHENPSFIVMLPFQKPREAFHLSLVLRSIVSSVIHTFNQSQPLYLTFFWGHWSAEIVAWSEHQKQRREEKALLIVKEIALTNWSAFVLLLHSYAEFWLKLPH